MSGPRIRIRQAGRLGCSPSTRLQPPRSPAGGQLREGKVLAPRPSGGHRLQHRMVAVKASSSTESAKCVNNAPNPALSAPPCVPVQGFWLPARRFSVKVICKLTPERAAHPGCKRVSSHSVYARLVAFRDSIDAADVPGCSVVGYRHLQLVRCISPSTTIPKHP